MNFFKSRSFVGVVCFVAGAGLMFLGQKIAGRQSQELPDEPIDVLEKHFQEMEESFNSASVMGKSMSTREDDQFIYYEIPVEGLSQEKVDVKVGEGQVNISGQLEKHESGTSIHSSFQRSFPVPDGADESKVQIEQAKDKIVVKFPKIKG